MNIRIIDLSPKPSIRPLPIPRSSSVIVGQVKGQFDFFIDYMKNQHKYFEKTLPNKETLDKMSSKTWIEQKSYQEDINNSIQRITNLNSAKASLFNQTAWRDICRKMKMPLDTKVTAFYANHRNVPRSLELDLEGYNSLYKIEQRIPAEMSMLGQLQLEIERNVNYNTAVFKQIRKQLQLFFGLVGKTYEAELIRQSPDTKPFVDPIWLPRDFNREKESWFRDSFKTYPAHPAILRYLFMINMTTPEGREKLKEVIKDSEVFGLPIYHPGPHSPTIVAVDILNQSVNIQLAAEYSPEQSLTAEAIKAAQIAEASPPGSAFVERGSKKSGSLEVLEVIPARTMRTTTGEAILNIGDALEADPYGRFYNDLQAILDPNISLFDENLIQPEDPKKLY